MRIALDAMGGDLAPAAPVEGALRALEQFPDVDVVLVGDPGVVGRELERHRLSAATARRLTVHDAPEVVTMDEDPVRAMKTRPRNSAKGCAELLGRREVDGVVNMGSTGAAVAAAMLFAERLEGVKRPGIAVPFPRDRGATVVLDCGANADARPEHLHQYAVMASLYARAALGVEAPRVGILSIGEEEHKGNRLVHETWAVFRKAPVAGFVGNVEAREFFEDRADVVVTDGFSGNVALKAVEGMAEYILRQVAALVAAGEATPKNLPKMIAGRVDYAEYGGGQLLGMRGAYVIGHGRSDARAVANGVRAARAYLNHGVDAKIIEQLATGRASDGSA